VVAPLRYTHYIQLAGLRGASGDTIPGALSILKGAVPDRARGLGHMAPTYFRREPGIDAPTAIAAPHFIYHHQASAVMAGLVPAIHVFDDSYYKDVNAWHEAGHDGASGERVGYKNLRSKI
jgi:hypothetical protein